MSTEGAVSAGPPLTRDRAFWGITATQFLGAFNDNVFKQLVLLICVDYVQHLQVSDRQSIAQALFAIPFVLLSGFAGWMADRWSKRTIVVWCKVLEIVVMLAGAIAFFVAPMYSDELLAGLFFVLFLMAVQSALFGPAKYGILPELFRESDLPAANGLVQMTTFMAIIFGMAVTGWAKDLLRELDLGLWIISAACVVLAIAGTLTSLWVRPTPIAHPGLPLCAESFGIDKPTWRMLRGDRTLLGVLLISSLFWFLGGLFPPAVNAYGKLQLGLNDTHTSLLAAATGVGIAIGCALSGKLSRHRIHFGLVRRGAWGMCLSSAGLAAVPWLGLSLAGTEALSAVCLLGLGISAGLFIVPLQVFLQSRPPLEFKGRMIGTMNLVNWLGILLAAAFFGICSLLFTLPAETPDGAPRSVVSWTFAVIAVLVLPVAIRYQPRMENPEHAADRE